MKVEEKRERERERERDPEELGNQKVIFCFVRILRKAEKNGDLDPQCWAILSMKILLSQRERETKRKDPQNENPQNNNMKFTLHQNGY